MCDDKTIIGILVVAYCIFLLAVFFFCFHRNGNGKGD